MIKRRILSSLAACKDIFIKALVSGISAERLSQSFCIGLYIAFSPFPGMHSVMMLASMYLWSLHFPTLFLATSINNPWTMIPFFSCDYAFGYWLLHSLFGWTPSWSLSLAKLFGSGKICVWSFLVGGNVLGVVAALISYPITNRIFGHLAKALSHKYTMNSIHPSSLTAMPGTHHERDIDHYENHSNQ